MIERTDAVRIQQLALAAIENLTRALDIAAGDGSRQVPEKIRRGVGLSIGTIETELLVALYQLHPDIDDLAAE